MKRITVRTISEYVDAVAELSDAWTGPSWFRGVASARYLPVPGILWRGLYESEPDLVRDFLVSHRALHSNGPMDPWELYAVMQHHGLPTRLLDWSKSSLVALYFALERVDSSNDAPVVWAMDPCALNEISLGLQQVFCPSELRSKVIRLPTRRKLNLDEYLPGALDATDAPLLPQMPIAIEPTFTSSRIRAQQGCFTVHGSREDSIDAVFAASDLKSKPIARITIARGASAIEMRRRLRLLGMTEDAIYQDLDSLSQRILRTYFKAK